MPNKITSLHSTFSVNGEVSNGDTRFMNITIDVMHLGENYNKSAFDKEHVEPCIESIQNTPVLGFIKYNNMLHESDFNGHEYIITRTANGIEEKYIGSAYGVIPESCNPRWVMKMCDDGVEREFLQVDALLWEKFSDATTIVSRDSEKAQSMELDLASIDGYEDDNGIFHFTKFKFDGCCILGDGVEPAMVNANVKIKDAQFSMDDFIKSVQEDLSDKFAIFTKLVNEENSQGGVMKMPNTNEDLNQVVETQFEETEQVVEPVEPEVVENNVFEQENEVVENEEDGSEVEADVVEENVEESELTDFEAEYNKIKAEYDEMFVQFNQMKSDYEAIKAEYDEMKPKYDNYVQAEEQRLNDEINTQKDAKFAEYEDDLAENPDFIALKDKKNELSVEDIEKECAVLYVRANRSKNSFSKSKEALATVGVLSDESENDNLEINSRYGIISVK